MSEQGIDLGKSGWENPEGFKPRARDVAPTQIEPVCEAPGPDGWVCDLPPGHRPASRHRADNGAGGITWETEQHETTTLQELARREGTYIQPVPMAMSGPSAPVSLQTVRELAEAALTKEQPSAWAIALADIVRLTAEL